MNGFKRILAIAAVLAAALSCGQKKQSPKMLVLYYSQTGGTKAVATEIAERLGADTEEIVALNPYDGDFQATIGRCLQEREAGILPEVQPLAADLSKYDVVFLGYPVWFGTFAPPVGALLDKIDLAGKKVVPFCTFGSGGLESSIRDLEAKHPDAEILPGYGVRAARLGAAPAELDRFLKENGFLEGDYPVLEDFPEQHLASEEEAAIFDEAVAGYPMLNAKASSVASRPVPGGKEFVFKAIDQPRNPKPDMPPAGELTIYVLAEDGQAPVFTRVIR